MTTTRGEGFFGFAVVFPSLAFGSVVIMRGPTTSTSESGDSEGEMSLIRSRLRRFFLGNVMGGTWSPWSRLISFEDSGGDNSTGDPWIFGFVASNAWMPRLASGGSTKQSPSLSSPRVTSSWVPSSAFDSSHAELFDLFFLARALSVDLLGLGLGAMCSCGRSYSARLSNGFLVNHACHSVCRSTRCVE